MNQQSNNPTIKYLNEGLTEILGDNGHSQIDHYIQKYGLECARGIVQRAGRAGLYYWLRDQAKEYGWHEPEYRLLSFRQKVMRGFANITEWLERNSTTKFQLDEQKEKVVIQCTNERKFNAMECTFYLGLFQEFLSWAASGKFFPAAEVCCPEDAQEAHVLEFRMNPLD